MRNLAIIFGLLLFPQFVLSQEEIKNTDIDSLYREDQFYVGVTYNLLGNKPNGVSQTGFSSGFHFGFVRDMPINKRRNVAIGLGIGFSLNSFNQNIYISKSSNNDYIYSVVDSKDFTKNKFSQHLIEFPFEFRWRLSTPTEYKFFRVHAGFRTGFVIASTSKFVSGTESEKISGINDFNDFQYALSLSLGYDTVNLYAYYSLNPIFDSNIKIDDNQIDMNSVKFGLIFYFL